MLFGSQLIDALFVLFVQFLHLCSRSRCGDCRELIDVVVYVCFRTALARACSLVFANVAEIDDMMLFVCLSTYAFFFNTLAL